MTGCKFSHADHAVMSTVVDGTGLFSISFAQLTSHVFFFFSVLYLYGD